MKSEHRHELAENDLSKLLARWAGKFDEHSNTILSVFVVIALIAAVAIYWTRTSRNQRASGWTQLAASSSPQDFESVADAFSGTPVADWARLRAAGGFLREGIERSVSDRSVSNELLEQAREAFESLTVEGKPPAIREQALNGLAVTLESLSDGDTEPAIAAYQQLLTDFPDTRFKMWADERIDVLKTGRVQEFYAWFHEQNPEPPDMPLPQDQPVSSQDPLAPLFPGGAEGPKLGETPFDVPSPIDDGTDAPQVDVNPFADEAPGDLSSDEPESTEAETPSTEKGTGPRFDTEENSGDEETLGDDETSGDQETLGDDETSGDQETSSSSPESTP